MIAPVYANLIGVCIMPLILMFITTLIWTVIRIFRSGMTWTKWFRYIKATIINMLFLVHPIILKSTMQMFACSKISGAWYLDIYMEDECFNGDHAQYSMTVAFPAFILWGIGFPFIAFWTLSRLNKAKRLQNKRNKKMYGFLYLGYTR